MAPDFAQSSQHFLASLDAEIERLQQMRWQVAAALGVGTKAKKQGPPITRTMSAEGRARIAAAQKARWAKQKGASKKAPTKKVATKQTPAKKTAARKTVAKKAAKSAPVKSAEA